jgi:glycosyl transferase family 87
VIYTVLFEACMAAMIIAAFGLCVPIARHLGTGVTAKFAVLASISVLALGTVPFHRYDPLVAVLIVLMCWATLERRPIVLGMSVAIGIVVKIVPIFAAAICGMYLLRSRRRRELIEAAIVAAAALAIVVIGCGEYIGLSHLAEMLWYHWNRPAEFESTAAALLGLWTGVEPRSAAITYAYGAINVVGKYDGIALAATNAVAAAGLLLVYLEAWRALGLDHQPADRARTLLVATTTVLSVIIGFGKVASAQYLVWLLPLGVLVAHTDEDWPAVVLLLGTLTLSQIVFPLISLRDAAMKLRPWAFGVVLARNLMLILWAATMFRAAISRAARRCSSYVDVTYP